MAELQWYKAALCLPLMATKAQSRSVNSEKSEKSDDISSTEAFAMAEHYRRALPISY